MRIRSTATLVFAETRHRAAPAAVKKWRSATNSVDLPEPNGPCTTHTGLAAACLDCNYTTLASCSMDEPFGKFAD